jgi:AcrR family transcriptional regulator
MAQGPKPQGPKQRRKAAGEAGQGSATAVPKGRAQKAAERREAILAAALDEFAARGYAATRLDDVAERAGVAKGTIYIHFADKEALFQEIVRTMVVPLVMVAVAGPPADVPIRRVVEGLMQMFIREVYGTKRREIIRLMLTEGPRFPALAEFYYHEVVERALAAMRGLLKRAHERGELRDDTLVRFPHLIVSPLILSIVWHGLFDRFSPLDVAALMRAHLDLLFGKERAS